MWAVTPCHVRWSLASIVGATGSCVVDLLGDLVGVLHTQASLWRSVIGSTGLQAAGPKRGSRSGAEAVPLFEERPLHWSPMWLCLRRWLDCEGEGEARAFPGVEDLGRGWRLDVHGLPEAAEGQVDGEGGDAGCRRVGVRRDGG